MPGFLSNLPRLDLLLPATHSAVVLDKSERFEAHKVNAKKCLGFDVVGDVGAKGVPPLLGLRPLDLERKWVRQHLEFAENHEANLGNFGIC